MTTLSRSVASLAKGISGNPDVRRTLARIKRRDFTLKSAAAVGVLFALIGYAIFDFVNTATQKDHALQESAFRVQLSDFLLLTREPDGSSLLENPTEFSHSRRSLRVVSVPRPFFNYFLTKGNARAFRPENLRWAPPRGCVLQFDPGPAEQSGTGGAPIQACFAAIPADTSGRFIYFALRYPSQEVHVHKSGRLISDGDRLVLRFAGRKDVRVYLAFERPPPIRLRKGVKKKRVDGVYELTGFLSPSGGIATTLVNAQAFVSRGVDAEQGQAFVNVLGRIDVSLLSGFDDASAEWPSRAIKSVDIGLDILPPASTKATSRSTQGVAPGQIGTALLSLEQAYVSAIPSRSTLAIESDHEVIWTSSDALVPAMPRRTGFIQNVSDTIAGLLVDSAPPIRIQQQQQVFGGTPVTLTLTATGGVLPDIATRAFLALLSSLIVVAFVFALLIGTFFRLDRLTRVAYSRAARAHAEDRLCEYADCTDQIGTLGRVLHILFSHESARKSREAKRRVREDAQKNAAVRHAQERLKAKQSMLDAIGHEIRSPLQSLLNGTDKGSDQYAKLERMRRAVENLYDAARIEDGVKSGDIVIETADLVEYLSKFAMNSYEEAKPVVFVGPIAGISANFDPITLEQILDHLIDNAIRHRHPGTDVEIQVSVSDDQVAVDVFNRGPRIPDDSLETIFSLGVTEHANPENRGQGLFIARRYALAMLATLHAENREGGVSFVITLPTKLELSI